MIPYIPKRFEENEIYYYYLQNFESVCGLTRRYIKKINGLIFILEQDLIF